MNSKVIALVAVIILLAAGAGTFLALNDGRAADRELVDGELQIYGNANGDWKIDERDITALESIISGEAAAGEYSDANLDGVIDENDISQVRALIDGSAQRIWLVDGDGHDKEISRDISRIGCEYYSNTELMLILGQKDKVTAVDNAPYQARDFYFGEGSAVMNMVNMNAPDYELVESMDLDILLTFTYAGAEEKQQKLTDVDVVYLGMYRPNVEEPTKSEYFQGILKAGYIFGCVERAEEYMGWLLDIRDRIDSVTSGISEEDKPTVLMTNYSSSYFQTGVETSTWSVYTSIDPMVQSCILAGGHPAAKDVLTEDQYSGTSSRTLYAVKVAPEAIVAADIDYAFCHCVKYTFAATVVAGPDHGYAVSDQTQMDEALATAQGRDLVDIDNIVIIAGDFRNGASGCMLLAAYMAKILHPDLFADMDPLEYHQSYVSDWMGIEDYNIGSDGVFISPAMA
jgi:iron complex transport system substrate-binding protein